MKSSLPRWSCSANSRKKTRSIALRIYDAFQLGQHHVLLLRRKFLEQLNKLFFTLAAIFGSGRFFFTQKLTGGYAQVVGKYLNFGDGRRRKAFVHAQRY